MKKNSQTFNIIQADSWSRMVFESYDTKEEAKKELQKLYNTEYYKKDMYTAFFIEEE